MIVTRKSANSLGLLLFGGAGIGLYVLLVTSVSDYRVSLVLLAAPLAVALLALKNAPRIYMAILVLSLSLGARFRFGGADFRPGGAEASLAPFDFPLLALLFLWLISSLDKRPRLNFRLSSLGKAFLLFALVHFMSIFLAQYPALALLEFLRLLKMGLLILVVRHFVKTERDLRYVTGALFLSVIAQAVLAVLQSLSGSSFGLGFLGESDAYWTVSQGSFEFGRAGGTLGHANVLGYFFELTLPLALAIYLWSGRGWLKSLSLLSLGGGIVGLFLTYSRASWVSLLIGFVAVIAITFLAQKRRRLRVLMYVALVLLGVVILVWFFRDAIVQRLSLFGTTSWDFRIQTFDLAWQIFQTEPSFGIGANNYFSFIQGASFSGLPAYLLQTPVHNILLLYAAETGWTGLIAFIVLLAAIVFVVRSSLGRGSALVSTWSIGLFAGFIAVMSHSMLDWLLRFDSVYSLFWFNIGLLVALRNLQLPAALSEASSLDLSGVRSSSHQRSVPDLPSTR